jgi:hypothetical protein
MDVATKNILVSRNLKRVLDHDGSRSGRADWIRGGKSETFSTGVTSDTGRWRYVLLGSVESEATFTTSRLALIRMRHGFPRVHFRDLPPILRAIRRRKS